MKVKYVIFLLLLMFALSACQAQYKVTFNIDENTSTSQIIKKGECIKIEEPTKVGYTFLGWYYNDEPFDLNTPIEKNMTFSAKFSPIDLQVTFFIDEDNAIVVDYVYNSIVREIEEPSKEEYIFLGWYLGEEKYDFSSLLTKDLTLFAKFVKDSEYTPELVISFNSTGAHVEIADMKVNRLDEFSNLPAVEREGYKFLGWYLDDKLVIEGDIIKEISNFTLIAKWEENK